MKSGLAEGGPLGYSDAGKRVSDAMALHVAAGLHNVGRWIACRLSDGGSDGIVYDDVFAAMRHQLHETQCMYLTVRATGIPPAEADVVLGYYRRAYDNGWRPSEMWAARLMSREGNPL